MGMRYDRHGAAVYRSTQWKAVRLQAKRRDGFRCVKCGACGRIEVDHIKPVRQAPELAYALDNLQCLCVPCHSHKTRIECGLDTVSPARKAWAKLLKKDTLPCSPQ